MWKDTCLQGCDLWNTHSTWGGCETELPHCWHSLRVSVDPFGKTPSPPSQSGLWKRGQTSPAQGLASSRALGQFCRGIPSGSSCHLVKMVFGF